MTDYQLSNLGYYKALHKKCIQQAVNIEGS